MYNGTGLTFVLYQVMPHQHINAGGAKIHFATHHRFTLLFPTFLG